MPGGGARPSVERSYDISVTLVPPFRSVMSRTRCAAAALVSMAALLVTSPPASAAPDPPPVSGAIFTTDASGVPVNLNHYANKRDVYLNGGPGLNAPDDAAGLPDGTYSFQVTDPS